MTARQFLSAIDTQDVVTRGRLEKMFELQGEWCPEWVMKKMSDFELASRIVCETINDKDLSKLFDKACAELAV